LNPPVTLCPEADYLSSFYTLRTESNGGHCWQVDPNPDSPNHSSPKKTLLGGASGGNYESVAVDNRDAANPVFFTTEDNSRGELRRFVADGNGWDALHVGGRTTYLKFSFGGRQVSALG
jgi:secreted PhoX family phosphatase